VSSISYKDAGRYRRRRCTGRCGIKPLAKRTMRPEVLAGIGGFGALIEISKKFKEPVLVSGTDGVGTKLKLAFELNRHDSVGIDLVAMSVNEHPGAGCRAAVLPRLLRLRQAHAGYREAVIAASPPAANRPAAR